MNLTSYRFRIPLSLAVVAIITALAFSLAVAYQTYRNIQIEQQRTGFRLAHAMEPVLARAIRHDDIWLAYSLLREPSGAGKINTGFPAPFLVLLDEQRHIFASNQPEHFPLGKALTDINKELARLGSESNRENPVVHWRDSQLLIVPVRSADAQVGTLMLGFSTGVFWDRFREILIGAAPVIGLVLLALVGIGWVWGQRIIAPLTSLSHCMERIGRDDITRLQCPTYAGSDEIGQLGQRFKLLLEDLRNKQALEEQAKTQERLAAIGRMAAGVAHEVNNPLGGLFAAIDTYRHTPSRQRDPDRTLALIERGLQQIHTVVSALLVESRLETRPLTQQDIDDVATLVKADAATVNKSIHWDNQLPRELPLPANAVRQILLNLTLNAIQATPPKNKITIELTVDDEALQILVSNPGEPIAPAILAHLFEPFQSQRPNGTGLGLWVTYQTVTQLGGDIDVESQARLTRFRVRLPLTKTRKEVA